MIFMMTKRKFLAVTGIAAVGAAAGLAFFSVKGLRTEDRKARFLAELDSVCDKKGMLLEDAEKRRLFDVADDYSRSASSSLPLLSIRNSIEASPDSAGHFNEKPVNEEMVAETLSKNKHMLDDKKYPEGEVARLFDEHASDVESNPEKYGANSKSQLASELHRLGRMRAIIMAYKRLPENERKELAAGL